MDNFFMELAYQEALSAQKQGEIPIGAIIVRNNEVLSTGYNQRQTTNKITKHAEIVAIENAAQQLNTWKLEDCTLYVTLEPCLMCTGAIIHSRIKRVVFGAYEKKEIALSNLLFQINDQQLIHHPCFTGGILEERCSLLILNYFKNKR